MKKILPKLFIFIIIISAPNYINSVANEPINVASPVIETEPQSIQKASPPQSIKIKRYESIPLIVKAIEASSEKELPYIFVSLYPADYEAVKNNPSLLSRITVPDKITLAHSLSLHLREVAKQKDARENWSTYIKPEFESALIKAAGLKIEKAEYGSLQLLKQNSAIDVTQYLQREVLLQGGFFLFMQPSENLKLPPTIAKGAPLNFGNSFDNLFRLHNPNITIPTEKKYLRVKYTIGKSKKERNIIVSESEGFLLTAPIKMQPNRLVIINAIYGTFEKNPFDDKKQLLAKGLNVTSQLVPQIKRQNKLYITSSELPQILTTKAPYYLQKLLRQTINPQLYIEYFVGLEGKTQTAIFKPTDEIRIPFRKDIHARAAKADLRLKSKVEQQLFKVFDDLSGLEKFTDISNMPQDEKQNLLKNVKQSVTRTLEIKELTMLKVPHEETLRQAQGERDKNKLKKIFLDEYNIVRTQAPISAEEQKEMLRDEEEIQLKPKICNLLNQHFNYDLSGLEKLTNVSSMSEQERKTVLENLEKALKRTLEVKEILGERDLKEILLEEYNGISTGTIVPMQKETIQQEEANIKLEAQISELLEPEFPNIQIYVNKLLLAEDVQPKYSAYIGLEKFFKLSDMSKKERANILDNLIKAIGEARETIEGQISDLELDLKMRQLNDKEAPELSARIEQLKSPAYFKEKLLTKYKEIKELSTLSPKQLDELYQRQLVETAEAEELRSQLPSVPTQKSIMASLKSKVEQAAASLSNKKDLHAQALDQQQSAEKMLQELQGFLSKAKEEEAQTSEKFETAQDIYAEKEAALSAIQKELDEAKNKDSENTTETARLSKLISETQKTFEEQNQKAERLQQQQSEALQKTDELKSSISSIKQEQIKLDTQREDLQEKIERDQQARKIEFSKKDADLRQLQIELENAKKAEAEWASQLDKPLIIEKATYGTKSKQIDLTNLFRKIVRKQGGKKLEITETPNGSRKITIKYRLHDESEMFEKEFLQSDLIILGEMRQKPAPGIGGKLRRMVLPKNIRDKIRINYKKQPGTATAKILSLDLKTILGLKEGVSYRGRQTNYIYEIFRSSVQPPDIVLPEAEYIAFGKAITNLKQLVESPETPETDIDTFNEFLDKLKAEQQNPNSSQLFKTLFVFDGVKQNLRKHLNNYNHVIFKELQIIDAQYEGKNIAPVLNRKIQNNKLITHIATPSRGSFMDLIKNDPFYQQSIAPGETKYINITYKAGDDKKTRSTQIEQHQLLKLPIISSGFGDDDEPGGGRKSQDIEREISRVNSEIEKLKQTSAQTTSMEQQELSALQSQKQNLADQIETLSAERKATSASAAQLQQQLNQAQTDAAAKQSEIENLQDQLSETQKSASEIKSSAASLESQIATTQIEVTSSKQSAEQAKIEQATTSEKASSMQQQTENQEQTVANATEQVLSLQAELASAQDEVEIAKTKIDDVSAKLETAQKETPKVKTKKKRKKVGPL